MTKLAFLGLGQMGTPMATRLLDAGHDVTVWNRTSARTKPLVDLGASAAATPADAVAAVDAVITMVATPQALEEVLFSNDGVVPALRPGQLLIDMSTVGVDMIRSVGGWLPDDATFVDAPVRGSVPEATAGRLLIYVGATEATFDRVRPLLETLGIPYRVGGPGTGAATKMVVNLVLGTTMTVFGEALALGDTLRLDRTTLLNVLAESPIGATVRSKRANVESGDYSPSFKLRHALKDIGLATDAVTRPDHELAVASAARGWLEQAAASGAADLDFSAVVPTIVAAVAGTSDPNSHDSQIA
jgi:3-hydroxyisobutyrate dehydrogenase-like beta-hydroxyacid dehydrogenase